MKSFLISATALLTTSAAFAGEPDVQKNSSDQTSYLFIQTADVANFDGETLTLQSDAGTVTYFSDRPARTAGTIDLEAFETVWHAGAASFAEDPPNAVLSFANGDPAVVELSDLQVDGVLVKYNVRVIDGALQPSMQRAVLVLDDNPVEAMGEAIGNVIAAPFEPSTYQHPDDPDDPDDTPESGNQGIAEIIKPAKDD